MPLESNYLDAIRGFEGFTPQAKWDAKQYSNGYGTKAQSPNEVIDETTARQRFADETGKASGYVAQAFPDLDPGKHAALASLTYNAGPGWINNSGLADAVRRGDWNDAAARFTQYNKSEGKYNEGLASRRNQEVAWFSQLPGQPISAQPQQTTVAPGALSQAPTQGPQPMADQQPALSAQSFAGPGALFGDMWNQVKAGGPGALIGAPHGVFPGADGTAGSGYDFKNAAQGAAGWMQSLDTGGKSLDMVKPRDDFSLINGPDGSIYRVNKKNGTVTPMTGPVPKIVDGEEDFLGNKAKLVNVGGKFTPLADYLKANGMAPHSGAGVPSSQSAADFQTIEQARQSGAKYEDLYKMVPSQIRAVVQGVLEGNGLPANMGRGKVRAAVIDYARVIDPSFDETKIGGRQQYQKGLAMDGPTTPGGQRNLLGTSLGHLAHYGELAQKAGNADTGIEPATILMNKARGLQGGGAGSPADVYNQMLDSAAKHSGEVGKLYSGNQGGGVHEREDTRARMSPHGSPSVIAGQLETSRDLVLSKLAQNQQQADEQMGIGRVKMITPQVQEYLDSINKSIAALRAQKNDPPSLFGNGTSRPPLTSFGPQAAAAPDKRPPLASFAQ